VRVEAVYEGWCACRNPRGVAWLHKVMQTRRKTVASICAAATCSSWFAQCRTKGHSRLRSRQVDDARCMPLRPPQHSAICPETNAGHTIHKHHRRDGYRRATHVQHLSAICPETNAGHTIHTARVSYTVHGLDPQVVVLAVQLACVVEHASCRHACHVDFASSSFTQSCTETTRAGHAS
jgi:hypothetical protein